MYPTPHPEVLARDWLPPVALGRESEVAEVVRRLDPPWPKAPPPWIVGVVGAAGAGTSTVARRAAREVSDRLRRSGEGVRPRLLWVRTAGLRGTHGVASALLRHLDEGFDGRGFPVTEILAGLLRRLRREGQPAVLILDDVHVGGPDLGPLFRALAAPDRFLPEGDTGIPPTWTVVAGTPEGWASTLGGVDDPSTLGRPVGIAPCSDRGLAVIVRDRAARALGRPASEDLVARVVEESVAEGSSARRAVDLLRRTLVGGGFFHGDAPAAPGFNRGWWRSSSASCAPLRRRCRTARPRSGTFDATRPSSPMPRALARSRRRRSGGGSSAWSTPVTSRGKSARGGREAPAPSFGC